MVTFVKQNEEREMKAESSSLHITDKKKKKGSKAGKTQVAVFTEKASVKERKNSHNLLEVIDSRSKNNPTSI